MGVPRFFRWLSERYPGLSQLVVESQIPSYDNFYLDFNGIIHSCSHPSFADATFRCTEVDIFTNIFSYIEGIFQLIKPRKLLFIAVDGVAPRAKMNQQRSRRFMSAKEAEDSRLKAIRNGEVIPDSDPFDSNCITPGTEFMERLHIHLKYFINLKLSSDPLWQNVDVYYSGHDCPGEGEHKILAFIRFMRSQADYDSNTTHCIYGLDADLIFLGMAMHEPYFSILREEVVPFRRSKKGLRMVEDQKFYLLHLILLREYICLEFEHLKQVKPDVYDEEKIIDDWIFMSFFIGNDFIPNVPMLITNENALPNVWLAYQNAFPNMDGYLNNGGHLNIPNLKIFFNELKKFEYQKYENHLKACGWLESKRAQRDAQQQSHRKDFSATSTSLEITSFSSQSETANGSSDSCVLQSVVAFSEKLPDTCSCALENDDGSLFDDDDDDSEDAVDMRSETCDGLYGVSVLTEEESDISLHSLFRKYRASSALQNVITNYVEALQWILYYYFHGVPSWKWFYGFHYAPFASDLCDFNVEEISFELGEPFLPFQQMLAVLPPSSRKLLPEPYQDLMVNPDSPLSYAYPEDVERDMNGKRYEWECILKLPFIDEEILFVAVYPFNDALKDDEKRRNRFGKCYLYRYSGSHGERRTTTYRSSLPDIFPDIESCTCECTELPIDHFELNETLIKYGRLQRNEEVGSKQICFPTFSFHDLKIKLNKAEVDGPLSLKLCSSFNMPLPFFKFISWFFFAFQQTFSDAAALYLGKRILFSWPYSIIGLCVKVSTMDSNCAVLDEDGNCNITYVEHDGNAKIMWKRMAKICEEQYLDKFGIKMKVKILLHYKLISGWKHVLNNNGNFELIPFWSDKEAETPVQLVLPEFVIDDKYFTERPIEKFAPFASYAFSLHRKCYGAMCQILEYGTNMRLSVSLRRFPAVRFNITLDMMEETLANWYSTRELIEMFQLLPSTLGRLTGSLLIAKNKDLERKVNIGLNLKSNQKSAEKLGYAMRIDGKRWIYSEDAVKLIEGYIQEFPDIIAYLEMNDFDALRRMLAWLKNLPSASATFVPFGTKFVNSDDIKFIEREVEKLTQDTYEDGWNMDSNSLFFPLLCCGPIAADPETDFQLFDRVINVRAGCCVPYGMAGTVINLPGGASHPKGNLEVLFDRPFVGGMSIRGSKPSAFRLPSYALVNFTYSQRKKKQRCLANKTKTGELSANELFPTGGISFFRSTAHPAVRHLDKKPTTSTNSSAFLNSKEAHTLMHCGRGSYGVDVFNSRAGSTSFISPTHATEQIKQCLGLNQVQDTNCKQQDRPVASPSSTASNHGNRIKKTVSQPHYRHQHWQRHHHQQRQQQQQQQQQQRDDDFSNSGLLIDSSVLSSMLMEGGKKSIAQTTTTTTTTTATKELHKSPVNLPTTHSAKETTIPTKSTPKPYYFRPTDRYASLQWNNEASARSSSQRHHTSSHRNNQPNRRKVRKVDEIAALLKRLLEDPEDTTSQRQPSKSDSSVGSAQLSGAKQDRIPRDGDMEQSISQERRAARAAAAATTKTTATPNGYCFIRSISEMNQCEILAECSDDESYSGAKVSDSRAWIPDQETAKELLEKIKQGGYGELPKLESTLPSSTVNLPPNPPGRSNFLRTLIHVCRLAKFTFLSIIVFSVWIGFGQDQIIITVVCIYTVFLTFSSLVKCNRRILLHYCIVYEQGVVSRGCCLSLDASGDLDTCCCVESEESVCSTVDLDPTRAVEGTSAASEARAVPSAGPSTGHCPSSPPPVKRPRMQDHLQVDVSASTACSTTAGVIPSPSSCHAASPNSASMTNTITCRLKKLVHACNGTSPQNRENRPAAWSSQHGLLKSAGHSRLPDADQELIRIVAQYLRNMGFSETVKVLSLESGCSMENPLATKLREYVFRGHWNRALRTLYDLKVFIEKEEDFVEMQFMLLQQKFLSLVEKGRVLHALKLLRDKMSILKVDRAKLNALSYFVMANSADVVKHPDYTGGSVSARENLMNELQNFLPTTLMLPPQRLQALIKQSLELQRLRCRFHNRRDTSPCLDISNNSLLSDHTCKKTDFPCQTVQVLLDHCDEVWYCQFSHAGKLLATGSKEGVIYIWDVNLSSRSVTKKFTLDGHSFGAAYFVFSPNDKYLACVGPEDSPDLWIWDTETGILRIKITHSPDDSISCVSWHPDGTKVVCGGTKGQFYQCDLEGTVVDSWEGVRVRSIQYRKDGRTVLAADTHHRIRSYCFDDLTDKTVIKEDHSLMHFSIDKSEHFALCSVANQGVHLWDLESGSLVRRYRGVVQGYFNIFSCFGGVDEKYVASGSEVGKVYIWHRDEEAPVVVLSGHSSVVNAVSWNPAEPSLLASCSDDGSVRIWGPHECCSNPESCSLCRVGIAEDDNEVLFTVCFFMHIVALESDYDRRKKKYGTDRLTTTLGAAFVVQCGSHLLHPTPLLLISLQEAVVLSNFFKLNTVFLPLLQAFQLRLVWLKINSLDILPKKFKFFLKEIFHLNLASRSFSSSMVILFLYLFHFSRNSWADFLNSLTDLNLNFEASLFEMMSLKSVFGNGKNRNGSKNSNCSSS
ncbi:5'-3' exoribonuclease 1, partial [Trichinella sp. T6]